MNKKPSSHDKKNSHHENSISKTKENSQNHPEIIRIDGIYKEDAIIKSKRKYHASQTRHVLAISLVISLLIVIIVFGVLHAIVDKEMIESLKDLFRTAITILSSLTGAAIGFFFGRDVKDS